MNFDLRDCCCTPEATLDVEHRGMEFDEEVKHVAMKHARLSEENVWPAAREQPDEETVSPAW